MCAVALGTLAPLAEGGPIAPPPGPVAPTQKTVITTLPYAINSSGSYQIWSNLTGLAGADGITINADDVTIDLNGFALLGGPGAQSGVFIDTTGGLGRNITIKNGSIRDWDVDGIRGTGGWATTVQDIWCDNTAGMGINITNQSTVVDCVVTNSALDGITGTAGCTVINCRTRMCTGTGIVVQDGSIALNCTSFGNADGYTAIESSVIQDCIAIGNTNFGAILDFGSTITGCTIRHSGGSGIECLNENVVENNRLSMNVNAGIGAGINVVGSTNRIVGNSVISLPGGGAVGIDVLTAQNTVYDNSGTNGAPDFQAVPGNDLGTLAPAAAGIAKSNAPY